MYILMFWIILGVVYLSVSGLKPDALQSTQFVTVINDQATLQCPVLNEVVKLDGKYGVLAWFICPSSGHCDGQNPWKWIAGMNKRGETKSERERMRIFRNGSLHINKVLPNDVSKYMCRVTRINYKSPLVYFVTLIIKENGSDQSANTNRTAKYVVVLAVLSVLLAAAAGYILYLKRIIQWGNCCCCNREAASDSQT